MASAAATTEGVASAQHAADELAQTAAQLAALADAFQSRVTQYRQMQDQIAQRLPSASELQQKAAAPDELETRMLRAPSMSKDDGTLTVLVTTLALTLTVAGPASAAPTHAARTHAAAVQVAPAITQTAAKATLAKALKAKCEGKNNSSIQWFGHQLKLDSCNTTRLVAALAVGAGGAGVVAAILAITGVGAAVAGVIAGVLGGLGGVVAFCGANGNGVIIDESWAGAMWCAGQ